MELLVSLRNVEEDVGLTAAQMLRDLSGVEAVTPTQVEEPPNSKSGLGLIFTHLIVRVVPGVADQLVKGIVELFVRPGAPPVAIEIGSPNGTTRITFDPRTADMQQVIAGVERLMKVMSSAHQQPHP